MFHSLYKLAAAVVINTWILAKYNRFYMIFIIAAHQDHLQTLEERPNLQNIMNATLII
jgi:hypothetical protein